MSNTKISHAMAGHRKTAPQPLRKRQHTSTAQTLILTASATALILTVCLCAFPFNSNGETRTRLDTCRATCDERLQSAALESTVTSLSPSSMDTLFLSQGGQKSTSGVRTEQPPNGSHANHLKPTQPQAAVTGRPRRLPTLIKILTGFGDEPYWNEDSGNSDSAGNNRPIIARIERPHFVNPAQRRRGTDKEPLSHEDTVELAAAAAAAAVWSKSIRIFGNNRMQRVNSEWDAALRWIAGWDQRHQQMPSSSDRGTGDSEPTRANVNQPMHIGGVSNDMSQEGFDNFVDDLARMLETCIKKCVEDENFEAQLGHEGPGEVVMAGASLVELVLRSLFGWVLSSSFSNISFGKLDMLSSESRFVISRAFQLAASSVVMYALHSLWILVSPVVSHWYSSLGYTESPEWLVEHERQIELAKSSSRSRQKKKSKRRQLSKQSGGRSKLAQKDGRNDKGTSGKDNPKSSRLARYDESGLEPGHIRGKQLSSTTSAEGLPQERESDEAGAFHTTAESTVPTSSRDSVSDSQDSSITEGVPSLISYSSTMASWSPPLKPIGSHLEDRDMTFNLPLQQGPPQLALGMHAKLGAPRGALFPPLQKATVPTQEQRDEAATQLREFQNAQIQRLLLQRKLSQHSSDSSRLASANTAPAHQTSSGLLNPGVSFHSSTARNPSTISSSIQHQSKVLKPPPGLPHPTEISYNPSELKNHDDDSKGFLTDNELFLSKLLDDDDDDGDVELVEAAPSPLQIGIPSMCPESSLDPSAAPFVFGGAGSETLFPKSKDESTGDAWQSGHAGEFLLKENSPSRMIKGVYGGSVW